MILWAPSQAGQVSFRSLTVPTERKAAELRARILTGESFETIARENSTDVSAPAGGFVGTFAPADLPPEVHDSSRFPWSLALAGRTALLPVHQSLTEDQVERMGELLASIGALTRK